MTKVLVEAPARLHFGILDMRGELGRVYGSVGLAVEEPRTVVEAREHSVLMGEGERVEEAKAYAEKILAVSGRRGVWLRVLKTAPQHVGLGSGTQLALSIGVAVSELFGLNLSVEEVALLMGRARVSGVGTYAFKLGGFVVDGGHRLDGDRRVPPLLFRANFPANWFFVVGIPRVERGLSGDVERKAMAETSRRAPPETAERASRVLVMKLLPSLVEEDPVGFGEALTHLQRIVGESFSEVQGGVYRHPVIAEGIEFLLRNGAFGAGQSSWGPTFYGLVVGRERAEDLTHRLQGFLKERCGGRAFLVAANNRGARVSKLS